MAMKDEPKLPYIGNLRVNIFLIRFSSIPGMIGCLSGVRREKGA
jgi:hypothetical protein